MLPLSDVRVLDLGQYISGPCASVLLAEMGADVIKVEPPAGDPFRKWESGLNASFVAFNRGKRSVVLNLKSDEDRHVLFDLARTADVLVENFRPGVTDRLGISYPTVERQNSKLIYCSITGFGGSGPYASMPAFDGVAQGYSGLAGTLMDTDDPRVLGPALGDAITGHTAARSILAALIARHRSARGQHLEISMFGALVHFLSNELSHKVVANEEGGPYARAHRSQTYVWVAKDGMSLIIHLSSPPKFWEGLCVAVDRPGLMVDPRFAERSQRVKNYEKLREELKPAFACRVRDKWLEVLQANHVPCAPVNTIAQAMADVQLKHLGIVDVLDEPEVGLMPRIRPPVHWNGAMLPPITRAPYLGEHTGAIMKEAKGGNWRG